MKIKTFLKSAALLLVAFSLICTSCFALNETLVYDNGGLLSSSEKEFLQTRLSELSKQYGVSLVVVTESSIGGKTAEEYADDFYDYNDYSDDGALCLLVFSENNASGENTLYISTKGSCISAFSDSDIDSYCQDMLQYLRSRDFYTVFKEFANTADFLISDSSADETGGFIPDGENNYGYDDDYYNSDEYKQYERNNLIKAVLMRLAIALVIGAIIGIVGVLIMKSKHKSVRMQKGAAGYVKPGSMVLTKSDDIFLYRTVSATERPKQTDSDSDFGSSTHTSSSGDTHGGGGISF